MNKTLLLATVCMVVGKAIAQTAPTANLTDFKPIEGEVFNFKKTSNIEITGSGANQTWDLTTATVTNNTYSLTAKYTNNSTTEMYHETDGGSREYKKYESDGIYETGVSIPNMNGISFTNTKKIIAFPLETTTVSNDTYASTQSINGQTIAVSGNYKSEYYGYGTVITPAGTFNNVICVKVTDVSETTMNGSPSGAADYTGYHFYKPGVHYYIAKMWKINSSTGQTSGGEYLNSSTAAIEEMNKLAFIVAPNPTSNGFNVSSDYVITSVKLFDVQGKEVTVAYDAATNFVDISAAPSGIYHLQVLSSAGIATQKVVKR